MQGKRELVLYMVISSDSEEKEDRTGEKDNKERKRIQVLLLHSSPFDVQFSLARGGDDAA
jgi:hypothetical protein